MPHDGPFLFLLALASSSEGAYCDCHSLACSRNVFFFWFALLRPHSLIKLVDLAMVGVEEEEDGEDMAEAHLLEEARLVDMGVVNLADMEEEGLDGEAVGVLDGVAEECPLGKLHFPYRFFATTARHRDRRPKEITTNPRF
jgi:hypothetical protein